MSISLEAEQGNTLPGPVNAAIEATSLFGKLTDDRRDNQELRWCEFEHKAKPGFSLLNDSGRLALIWTCLAAGCTQPCCHETGRKTLILKHWHHCATPNCALDNFQVQRHSRATHIFGIPCQHVAERAALQVIEEGIFDGVVVCGRKCEASWRALARLPDSVGGRVVSRVCLR